MAKPCIKQLCTCEGYGDCQAVKEIIKNSEPNEFNYIICKADMKTPPTLKLTEEQYNIIIKILKEEGGNFSNIAQTRFGIDTSSYEHYYGFNKPID